MFKIIRILQLVLVNYFYQTNAALFLFGFFVLFGLPISPLQFHLSLITGIIKSRVFLLCVMAMWLLYNFKCINYINKQIISPRHVFLSCLNSVTRKNSYVSFVYVQLLVYLPVIMYACAITFVAIREKEILCAFEIIAFNLAILLITPLVYIRALEQGNVVKRSFFFKSLTIQKKKAFFLFPLYFLMHDRKQMLLITKIFSLFVLYLFIKFYIPEQYDIRPVQLCLLLVAAANCIIIFEIQAFEQEYLIFAKNLPIHLFQRFLQFAGLFTFILLPELIFLIKGLNIQFRLIDYPQLVLLVVSLLCMFYVVLLLDNNKINQDAYVRIVFGILSGCFFIILYSPGLALSVALLALAYALFASYYYHYEERKRN